MAIVQISKIQQRSGNLVDLPQLDEAEFGFASDAKRVFIGKTQSGLENIEVLTSYSEISFSQIDGAIGNLNISSANIANGQVLAYDGNNWVNRGGSAGGLITLGNVSNVRITGGSIGYVLETDGLGNLSWTPKGALYSNIIALSNATPIVMTVANTTPYVNDSQVTITGVTGVANSNVNGLTFYVQLASNFPTTGNVSLYTSPSAVGPANGTSLTYTNSPNAIATSTVGGSGTGNAAAGANTSIQYNFNNVLAGDSGLTWNGSTLAVTGNANITGNINVTGPVTATRFISNVTTGTAPLQVSSTTIVANLNADLLDGYNTSEASSATTIVVRDANGNVLASNVYANTGTVGASLLAGTLTTAAQPNITSTGTLTSLGVSGNITAANITANTGIFSGNGSGLSALNGSNITTGTLAQARLANASLTLGSTALTLGSTTTTVAGLSSVTSTNFVGSGASLTDLNAGNLASGTVPSARLSGSYSISVTSATTAGTVTTAAQPNITSTGTLTSLTVSGNANAGNVGATSFIGSGASLTALNGSNITTGTVAAARVATLNQNTTGTAGTVTTAAQPNITSVGTLTSLSVTGNANVGNVGATNFVGSGASLTALNGSNITTGTVAAARVATLNQNTTGSAATVTTAAQPNITSVGTLTSLAVTGDVLIGTTTYTPIAGIRKLVINEPLTSGVRAAGISLRVNNTELGSIAAVDVGITALQISTPDNLQLQTGGITRLSINSTGNVSITENLSVTGNITSANVYANSGTVIATTLRGTDLTTGANTTPGNITGNWTLTAGSRLQATYADLAEYYEGDQLYVSGTVLEFGGDKEVTIATEETNKLAGVVSTNPAYVMNSECLGNAVAIALQGRCPVKVKGPVCKGDMMTSAGNGYAKATVTPNIGTVLGKSLENFEGEEGVIEIAVGRL